MSELIVKDTISILYDNKIYKSLISLIKKCYDYNPYITIHEKLMWYEQCSINIPLLYLASIYLYIYAKSKNCDTFLFATRDCCHWVKIFSRLFPDERVFYYQIILILYL